MNIIIAIIIFSAIILFHELGHFLLAKKNGIEVLEFSLGMGPTIWSKEKGGTIYSLKILPLGGSCMMLGEDEDETAPGSFNAASVPARMSVIAAGPIFNFILAFILAVVIVSLVGYIRPTVTEVDPESPVAQAGLQEGDLITSFNGYGVDIWQDFYAYTAIMGIPTDSIDLTVRRGSENIELTYEPETVTNYLMGFQKASTEPEDPLEVAGLIRGLSMESAGVEAGDIITAIDEMPIENNEDYEEYIKENPLRNESITLTIDHDGSEKTVEVTPQESTSAIIGFNCNQAREKGNILQTIKYGAMEVKYYIKVTILSLKGLVTGRFGIKDLSGPVGVVSAIGNAYEQGRSVSMLAVWTNVLGMALLLTANLGVMNLIPIPALDGGRLLFLIFEAILRKPLNRRIEGTVNFAGFMLLMALMAVVMFNDIMKLF